jgi:uncharacterized protein with FMN-binding domain
MKRGSWLVLAGVVAGFFGVLGSHRSAPASALGGVGNGTPGPSGPSAGSGASTAPAAGPSAAAGPTAAASGPARSVSGAMEQYGYGELAARVTVHGGRITNVTVPLIRTAEQYSQQLASQVIPMLRNEVLSAQGANINAVSGATYTSQAYALSVQAALDKVHFK